MLMSRGSRYGDLSDTLHVHSPVVHESSVGLSSTTNPLMGCMEHGYILDGMTGFVMTN